jgi:hypothetical protein
MTIVMLWMMIRMKMWTPPQGLIFLVFFFLFFFFRQASTLIPMRETVINIWN